MNNTRLLLILAFSLNVLAGAEEENWGQWRGPLKTGAAATATPPLHWNEKQGVKWKVRLPGAGTATPIIWGDHIFIQTAVPAKKIADYPSAVSSSVPTAQQQGGAERRPRPGGPGGGAPRAEKPDQVHQFVLMDLERETGKIRWQKVAKEEVPHEGHHPDHGFSSSSPVTDGEQVFAYFGSRGLHAFDLNGNAKWSKDLGRMQTKMSFGEGSSPALYQDKIIVNWDHEGADFIAAFDKRTGRELWRTGRDEDTTWATPLVMEHEGKAQVITAATRKIRSYDVETGKQIWECNGLTPNAIPTPVPGNGVVYLTSGFRGSALYAIKLGKTGDVTETDAVLWKLQKGTPYVPSPLLYESRLYFYSGNNAILSCFNAADGKPVFEAERLEGLQGVYASPVAANGRIYLVGRNGTTLVLKSGDKLEVLATNQLDEKFDASPSLAGKELFLRGHEFLYCLSE